MEGTMRTLIVVTIVALLAACSTPTNPTSGHPGVIGGEQAVKKSSLGY
jgi:hypothetical protein